MKKLTTKNMKLLVIVILVTVIVAATLAFIGCGKKAVGIEVTVEPSKTAYTVGDTFDTNGMVVSVLYSNGKSEEIEDYTYDLTGKLKATDTKVTIFYKDFVTEVSIKVYNPLTGISVKEHATKTEYKSGEVFDPNGMVLSLIYKDGSTKPLNVDETVNLSFDDRRLKVGETEVEISYAGFTTTETISVIRGSIIETSVDNDFESDKTNSLILNGKSAGVETDGEVYVNGRIGSLDKKDKYVKYTFKLEVAGKVDFVWKVAGNHWVSNVGNGGAGNGGVPDLEQVAELTVDNFEIDVAGIELPRGEDKNATEEGYNKSKDYWNLQKFVIKDLELAAGEHTFYVKLIGCGLNVDSLMIYSDSAFVGDTTAEEELKMVVDADFVSQKSTSAKFDCNSAGVDTNGDKYTANGRIGGLTNSSKYITYTFTLEEASKIDLIWKVAGNKWNANAGGEGVNGNLAVDDLGKVATITIDGKTVDVNGIALTTDDITNFWKVYGLVLKDLDLAAGEHKIEVRLIGAGLNVDSLTVCANTTIGGAESA